MNKTEWIEDFDAGDLAELTVVEAVALLCDKQISASEYVEALLQRHEETACLNGYSENHPEKVNLGHTEIWMLANFD